MSESHCLSEDKRKKTTAFWKHVSNYTAILQVKSKFTPFYTKDFFSNHNVILCATYGEKYNIIYIFIYTQVVKKKKGAKREIKPNCTLLH